VIAELYQRGMTPETFARVVRQIDRSLPVKIGSEVIDNDMPLDGVIDSASFADVALAAAERT